MFVLYICIQSANIRFKEVSQDLRKAVIKQHQSGFGYKKIGKLLATHCSTVRIVINIWQSRWATKTLLQILGNIFLGKSDINYTKEMFMFMFILLVSSFNIQNNM